MDDLDCTSSKIAGYLKTIAQLQGMTEIKETQLNFYAEVNNFLDAINRSCRQVKYSESGFHFLASTNKPTISKITTNSMKIRLIHKQAALWNKQTQPSLKRTPEIENNCKVSQHLASIFKQSNEGYLAELVSKKDQLYKQISGKVEEDEPHPLIAKKIIDKIHKSARKRAKIETITQLERIVEQNKNWIKGKQDKIEGEISEQQIEDKIKSNLVRMKELMGKKMETDRYLQETATDEVIVAKDTKKIIKLAEALARQIQEKLAILEEYSLEMQLDEYSDNPNISNPLTENKINEINSLASQGLALLRQPLQSTQCLSLLEKADEVNRAVIEASKKI